MPIRWHGELSDGHIHMTSAEYCEHKAQETDETNKQMLRKIANNPILSDEAKAAIRYAVYRLDDNIWMRNRIYELQEQCRNMKARKEHESI